MSSRIVAREGTEVTVTGEQFDRATLTANIYEDCEFASVVTEGVEFVVSVDDLIIHQYASVS